MFAEEEGGRDRKFVKHKPGVIFLSQGSQSVKKIKGFYFLLNNSWRRGEGGSREGEEPATRNRFR